MLAEFIQGSPLSGMPASQRMPDSSPVPFAPRVDASFFPTPVIAGSARGIGRDVLRWASGRVAEGVRVNDKGILGVDINTYFTVYGDDALLEKVPAARRIQRKNAYDEVVIHTFVPVEGTRGMVFSHTNIVLPETVLHDRVISDINEAFENTERLIEEKVPVMV